MSEVACESTVCAAELHARVRLEEEKISFRDAGGLGCGGPERSEILGADEQLPRPVPDLPRDIRRGAGRRRRRVDALGGNDAPEQAWERTLAAGHAHDNVPAWARAADAVAVAEEMRKLPRQGARSRFRDDVARIVGFCVDGGILGRAGFRAVCTEHRVIACCCQKQVFPEGAASSIKVAGDDGFTYQTEMSANLHWATARHFHGCKSWRRATRCTVAQE